MRMCCLHTCASVRKSAPSSKSSKSSSLIDGKGKIRKEKTVTQTSGERERPKNAWTVDKTSHIEFFFYYSDLVDAMVNRREKEKKKIPRTDPGLMEEKSLCIFLFGFLFSFFRPCSLVHINIINNIRAERYQFHINIHKS